MAASLVITIFQTLLFLFMGPSLLFFGCAARTVGIFVQAVLASGWLDIVSAIKALEVCNVFYALNVAVMVFTGAVALAVAMIGNPKVDYTAKGMLLFYFLADTPMKLLSDILFKTVGGCTSIGEPTLDFPHGQPEGPAPCSCDHTEFVCALYSTKILTWLITFLGAYVGNRYWKVIGAASYAMAGALMTIKCYTELLMMISMEAAPEDTVNAMLVPISAAELVLIYGFAVMGFFIQRNANMIAYVEAVKESLKPGGETPEDPTGCPKFLMCRCFKVWLKNLMILDRHVTRIIAAGQAATAISKSNTAAMLGAAKADIDEKDAKERDAKDAKVQKDATADKADDPAEAANAKVDPEAKTAQYLQVGNLTAQKTALEAELLELKQKFEKQENELKTLKQKEVDEAQV